VIDYSVDSYLRMKWRRYLDWPPFLRWWNSAWRHFAAALWMIFGKFLRRR